MGVITSGPQSYGGDHQRPAAGHLAYIYIYPPACHQAKVIMRGSVRGESVSYHFSLGNVSGFERNLEHLTLTLTLTLTLPLPLTLTR